ncbi:MAG: hypothetical protein WC707_01590 [Candidatus Babeliaceae bacterium]|jgi:hypothetical protein
MKKSSINRRSRVVLCIGLLLSVTASRAGQLSIKDSSIFSPKELGIVSLTRDSEGFHVIQNGVKRSVKNHWVDKTLRSIPSDKMEKFLQHGYISVNKMSDGEFTLNAKVRGNGGAYFGAVAGTIVGGAVVQGAYHGTLAGIGFALSPFITPVGAGAVVGIIRTFTMPAAILATKTVAIAGGIVGGVITGPI